MPKKLQTANRVDAEDHAFHEWYRFVLSFPPHLVRQYIEEFGLDEENILLDPFCGTGTTLVEAKLKKITAIGLEANPFAKFASAVKVDWGVPPKNLIKLAKKISDSALEILKKQGIEDTKEFQRSPEDIWEMALAPDSMKLLLSDSISPIPLHKTLVLLYCIKEHGDDRAYSHLLLALANAVVFKISNLHFGPEVGVKKTKRDVPVIKPWLNEIERMAADLHSVSGKCYPSALVFLSDSRKMEQIINRCSVDAVITSPPYPNEKDYTRTTRLESVLLGFIKNKAELRELKKQLIRSNTRGVYKDDDDDKWVEKNHSIQNIAESIEKRRLELGKTSGFEKLYGTVTKLYFGGMARHLSELRTVLKPGAQLAYVVGDQASYLRVMIRTGTLLAQIAEGLGYEVQKIETFRKRFATATKEYLNEEVVVLKWHGPEHL